MTTTEPIRKGKPRRDDVAEIAEQLTALPADEWWVIKDRYKTPEARKAVVNSLRRTHFPDRKLVTRTDPLGSLFLRLEGPR